MSKKLEYEFLNDVAIQEIDMVAQKWAPKMGWAPEKAEANCRAWLHRIRETVKREQTHLNTIYALQKKSARIRKFTISGAIPEIVADMES
jgi:hypothetical protein